MNVKKKLGWKHISSFLLSLSDVTNIWSSSCVLCTRLSARKITTCLSFRARKCVSRRRRSVENALSKFACMLLEVLSLDALSWFPVARDPQLRSTSKVQRTTFNWKCLCGSTRRHFGSRWWSFRTRPVQEQNQQRRMGFKRWNKGRNFNQSEGK